MAWWTATHTSIQTKARLTTCRWLYFFLWHILCSQLKDTYVRTVNLNKDTLRTNGWKIFSSVTTTCWYVTIDCCFAPTTCSSNAQHKYAGTVVGDIRIHHTTYVCHMSITSEDVIPSILTSGGGNSEMWPEPSSWTLSSSFAAYQRVQPDACWGSAIWVLEPSLGPVHRGMHVLCRRTYAYSRMYDVMIVSYYTAVRVAWYVSNHTMYQVLVLVWWYVRTCMLVYDDVIWYFVPARVRCMN